jgi:hypothetical protein
MSEGAINSHTFQWQDPISMAKEGLQLSRLESLQKNHERRCASSTDANFDECSTGEN